MIPMSLKLQDAVTEMTDSDLERAASIIERERRRRKLGEYNRRLAELLAAAAEDGIQFVYSEPGEAWCSPVTTNNIEAAI